MHDIAASGNATPPHPCTRGISASLRVIDVRGWKPPESKRQTEAA